jgi:phosphohistidine phosphatase
MATTLYLVRHAVAVDKSKEIPDAARPLTPKGRDRFEKAARGLARLGVKFDVLLHSPKLRAVQTAEALADEDLVDGETVVTAALARAPTNELLTEIVGESVAAVGHEPHLSALAAWLLTGEKSPGKPFVLKKGGVMALEGEPRPGAMKLVAVWPPKTLRKLAKS